MSAITLAVTGTRVDGVPRDILVAGQRIAAIEPHDPARRVPSAARVVDGANTHALPGLMNTHTHAAMVLMRSLADDMALMPWLEQKIWPLEARLTAEDVYWGTRLACVEMIRSGTTFFSDMYWHAQATARAVRDAGMRALVAGVFIDLGDPARAQAQQHAAEAAWEARQAWGPRVGFALGPHAIYTVSDASLRWIAQFSERHDVLVHLHVAETAHESAQCLQQHGVSPVRHLEQLGLLSPRLLAAHSVHLDDEDIALYARHGVHALHNPVSNLKLASGGPMRYAALRAAGVNVAIGTDGCASNNNLDVLEELKFAALMAKHSTQDPTTLPAAEALSLATTRAAQAVRLDAGELAAGKLADFILVDAGHLGLFPGHDLAADLVHSAHGDCVSTSVIDGQVVMQGGVVPGEVEIRQEVRARLRRLLPS